MINHIVLFKIKQNIEQDTIDLLENKFFELKNNIPEILEVSGGNNISQEEFHKGFNKGYILLFKDVLDLQTYLVSKEHKIFVEKYVSKTVEDVLVFDYIMK